MRITRFARPRVLGATCLLSMTLTLLPASPSPSPAPAAVRLELRAGPAAETLRRFAEASGLEIAFLADDVRGIETPALRTELPPRAALDRLLLGTGLVVIADARTGALLVSRRAPARPPGRAGLTAAFAATLAAFGGGLAPAEGAAPAADAVQLAAFTVTGSNIPTAADAVAAPITIISRDEIERTGVASNQIGRASCRERVYSGV